MEYRQLHYFLAVAEELHFGRAADRLQITQPALSKQIAGIETELGVRLLLRTKRTVQLTPAGQVFLQQTKQLLIQMEAAIQLTQRTASGEIGHLTLGFTETAAHTVLPQWIRTFRDLHPTVEITMQGLSTEAQVKALQEDRIDLACLHPPIDQRGLHLCPILKENFVVVLPPDHPLAHYDAIPIAALADQPLVIHPRSEGPNLYDGFIQICQQAGFTPRIVQESISLQVRICLAASGIGITFTTESLQPLIGNQAISRPLVDCPIALEFAVAWRKTLLNPVLMAFLRSIGLELTRE